MKCFYDWCICKLCINILILLLFVEMTLSFMVKRKSWWIKDTVVQLRATRFYAKRREWIDGDVIIDAYYV